MNKILNWVFGACFRTLGRFLAIFIVVILLIFIGSKLDIELPDWLNLKVNASTITSYDATFTTSNRYYYSTSNTLQNNSLGIIGNVYSGKSYNFTFYLNTSSLTAQNTYDITINANSNDFTKNLNASSIYIKTSNSTDFTNSTNGISLISFTNNATSSKNSNKIVLRIFVNSLSSYTMIDIFNFNLANITSVSNFGIKSLSIDEVDTSGNNEIIENDKNNTQNIINNSNQNTDEIKNSIKDNLNSCRESVNLFDKNNIKEYNATINYYNEGFTINSSSAWGYGEYITTLSAGTYTLSGNINGNVDFVEIYKNDVWLIGANLNTTPYTFTINEETTIKFRFYATTAVVTSGSTTFFKIQLQKGTNATPFEEYGVEICNNKLDDLNNNIGDINDSITSNDITGAQDSASGFFDNFSSEDYGISSIITAPLRAINAMLNNTCVAPGATYKGQSFSLPCGSMLWDRPGGLDLKNFINVMYGGFLVYFVIRSLFLDIEKLKNPDSDKVEVSKL